MQQASDTVDTRFVFDWLKQNLRKKGPAGVFSFAISYASDYWFDIRYGTATGGWIAPDKLDVDSENVRHSVRYQATKQRPFQRLMKGLTFPEGSVFVDVGCGKGKAVLIASCFRFKQVRGIEFSPELCRIARLNAEAYRKRAGPVSDIEIIESDIVDYDIKDDENVFYLYNPFDDVILRKFLQNVRTSIRENPRKIWLIYHIAKHGKVVEEQGIFTAATPYVVGGTEFVVYESA